MNYERNRKNIVMTTSDGYEIKLGRTVYVISHEYGTADFAEIVTDYISEKRVKKNTKNTKKSA